MPGRVEEEKSSSASLPENINFPATCCQIPPENTLAAVNKDNKKVD
jgi:hypothetical protein